MRNGRFEGLTNRSPLLAQILEQMQRSSRFQPQSYGALAAGLGEAALNQSTLKDEMQREQKQKEGQAQALAEALSSHTQQSTEMPPTPGGPIDGMWPGAEADPNARQNLMGGLIGNENPMAQALAGQLMSQQFAAPQVPDDYTLDKTRFSGATNKPIASIDEKDNRQKGTAAVHIGGGRWQKFTTMPDGSVDMTKPIGEPYTTEPGADRVNVSLPPQENEFEKELGKGLAASVIEGKKAADDAVEIINTIHEGRRLLDSGAISGIGAQYIVNAGKALRRVGFSVAEDDIANTEAYAATMAQNVGKIIKIFGAGTGLSDADREYAQKMAAGEISLEEKSLRKIMEISEQANRNVIQRHNKKVEGIKSKLSLTVVEPSYMGGGPAPEGVTPEEWANLTPEERALFR